MEIIKAHQANIEKLKLEHEKEIADLIASNRRDIDIEIAKLQKMIDDKTISNSELKTRLDNILINKTNEFQAKKKEYDIEKD